MIQDIYPHRLFNHYQPGSTPRPDSYIFYFRGSKMLVKYVLADASACPVTLTDLSADTGGASGASSRADDTSRTLLEFPRAKDFKVLPETTYLFAIDAETYFLLNTDTAAVPEGFAFHEFLEIRDRAPEPKHRVFAAMTARHLADWYRDNRFCGRCGRPMKRSDEERAMVCAGCGYTCYPRIMPAVIVGVTDGDRLLVTRYRTGYRHHALIAGFTEIGETLEETVAREVMEEAGIRVKNIRYYKSQPWGMANDILAGFYCDVDGDAHIHMDSGELSSAEWIEREEIVLQPDDFSLTNEMMMQFKLGKR